MHKNKISVLADIVLNHKTGADEKEQVPVIKVKDENRLEKISEEYMMEAFTSFKFPGRKGKYSEFIWDFQCFTGLCHNDEGHLIMNEYSHNGWDDLPDNQHGNYDFLLGSDIEFRNPHVREELMRWGEWYVKETGIDGFRLDALKHIQTGFFPEWLDHLNTNFNRTFFTIGEYWKNDVGSLLHYIDLTQGKIQLFDVPLHFNFHEASVKGGDYDLRTIFDNTLVSSKPELAITFVDNHDTQPLQSLQSPVDDWFAPLAYAIILLREQGIPCVFYPSFYGGSYVDEEKREDEPVRGEIKQVPNLKKIMQVRKDLAYGTQRDYFESSDIIGWVREGNEERKRSGCAVVICNPEGREIRMSMGERFKGRTMKDITGSIQDPIVLDENGEGLFRVGGGSVSVWVDEKYSGL